MGCLAVAGCLVSLSFTLEWCGGWFLLLCSSGGPEMLCLVISGAC